MAFLYVKAHHGLSKSFDSNKHKPQFLAGLRDRLQKLGFRVDLIPVNIYNYCMLEICGHEVFRCKLENFNFNTSYDRDVVCERAIEAVMEASVKFRRARAYLWFWTLLEHQLFKRGKHSDKDFWVDILDEDDLKNIPCLTCSPCCDKLCVKEDEDL